MVLVQRWPFFLLLFFQEIQIRRMCFLGGGIHVTKHMCIERRETDITRDMCSTSRETHIPSDMCFLGRGTHITSDICFLGGGTHITRDKCFSCKKTPITRPVFVLAIQAKKTCFMIFQNEYTTFQAIKTRSSKSRKIDIFPKRLVHGFRIKLVIFPISFFQAIQAKKMCFMIFQNENTTFQAIKTRSSHSRNTEIFPKWLVHGFTPKLAIFPNFFQAIQAMKMCFMILQNEKTSFLAIKTKSSNSRKVEIFPKGLDHGFQSKNGHFSFFCFLGNQDQENVFPRWANTCH